MKKINNKGLTLIELLISIVMLTISIVLMYGLMSNLQKKRVEVDSRTKDIVKISDIEQTIQEYMMGPVDVNYGRQNATIAIQESTSSKIIIKITTDSNIYENTITISSDKHIINYSQKIGSNTNNDATTKWDMGQKECTIINYCEKIENYCTTNSKYISIKCKDNNTNSYDYINIPIYIKPSA